MTLIQILGLFVLIGILFYLIKSAKKRVDAAILLTIMIFVLLLIIAIIPQKLESFLEQIGFWRPFDAFLTLLSTTSLILALKIYLKQKEAEKAITKIIQHLALNKEKENK
jgi:hypothetical protein